MILLVIGIVAAIYVIRFYLGRYETVGTSNSQIIASVLNSLFITFLNIIYSKLAIYTTQRENHR